MKLNNTEIDKIAKIRMALEITIATAEFEMLSNNEERLMLLIWMRNNLDETLANVNPKVIKEYSDSIEKIVKEHTKEFYIKTKTN